MFSLPTGPGSPKTKCVSCGARSKWICQGCKQWFCQNCAPTGLCPTHYEMLDTEEKEALAKVMTLFSTKIKKLPILMGTILVPAIFIPVMMGIFIDDIFYFLTIPIVLMELLISFLIIIHPLRKDLPRLKQMARKYNFGSGPSPNREPYSLSESPPTQPMSNVEAMRQRFKQPYFPPASGISSSSTQASSLFTRKFICFCFLLVIVVVGVVIGFTLMQNS